VTTTTVAKVILAPRERQVLEGLADGSTLAAVALNLKVREGTAADYLKLAKRKLYGVSENAAALAVGYATEAIDRPTLLEPDALVLPREQRDLVPLIARGMTAAQMATELKRPVAIIPGGRPRVVGEPPGPQPRPPRHPRVGVPDSDRGPGDRMAALTPAVPDKVEIVLLAEAATSWDLNGQSLPDLDDALALVEQFTDYGRIVADDLRTLCLSIPADSSVGVSAQATLSEASRRLYLPPPSATQQPAARRAQNLARLVQALVRATGEVSEVQARAAPQARRRP
jgi:DNA-binding CsgD family transcriptional regulator